jgi:hypothetical protein
MSGDMLISGKRWSRIPPTRRSSVTTLSGSRFFGFNQRFWHYLRSEWQFDEQVGAILTASWTGNLSAPC